MKGQSLEQFTAYCQASAREIESHGAEADTYLRAALPHYLDLMIERAIQECIIDPPEETRRLLACQAFASLGTVFGVYALRASMNAVRQSSVTILRTALAAACIELRAIDDYRYSLMTLSVVYRAAEHIGIDAGDFFRSSALCPGSESNLESFASRDPHSKSIEAMGFYEGYGPAGILFWPDPDQAPPGWLVLPSAGKPD